MAYTRALVTKVLRDLGITDESDIKSAVQELMDLHVSVTDPMKKQLDEYKAEVEDKGTIQAELDKLKKDDWKAKYEAEHTAFETFKADATAKSARTAKESAYRDLLTKAGISEKYLAQVLRVADLDKVEMDEKGGIKDADKLSESIKTEWSAFIPQQRTDGAKVDTPPDNSKGKMTRDQIMSIKDRAERRAAIAANPEAFTHV